MSKPVVVRYAGEIIRSQVPVVEAGAVSNRVRRGRRGDEAYSAYPLQSFHTEMPYLLPL